MRRSTRGPALIAAAILVGAGMSVPAQAAPAGTAGTYIQTDVSRSLDVGLLAANGDRRFDRPKAEMAVPAEDKAGRTFVYVEGRSSAAAKAAVKKVGGTVTHI